MVFKKWSEIRPKTKEEWIQFLKIFGGFILICVGIAIIGIMACICK